MGLFLALIAPRSGFRYKTRGIGLGSFQELGKGLRTILREKRFCFFARSVPLLSFVCNRWEKRTERPNAGGVSIRSRSGAPSRK